MPFLQLLPVSGERVAVTEPADLEAFRAWRSESSRWLPVVRDIARSHGLSDNVSHVFATGTNIVVALDERPSGTSVSRTGRAGRTISFSYRN